MACIVKLKDNCYIEWSKTADAPSSKLMDKPSMVSYLTEGYKFYEYTKQKPLLSLEELLIYIEVHGTSDIGKGVDLEFILKYNSLAETKGRSISLDEFLNYFF